MRLPFAAAIVALAPLVGSAVGCDLALGLGDYERDGAGGSAGGATTTTGPGGGGGGGAGGAGSGGSSGVPFLEGWSRRKPITIWGNKLMMPLSNFKWPIVTSDAQLLAGLEEDGFDLRFTSGDGESVLRHELESKVEGGLVAWVLLEDLPQEAHTIYMYYGNEAAPDCVCARSRVGRVRGGLAHDQQLERAQPQNHRQQSGAQQLQSPSRGRATPAHRGRALRGVLPI